MMLRVEVHLHGGLLRYSPDSPRGPLRREYPAGTRVADVLASFEFPAERRVIVGVNGQTASLDDVLPDGARIDLVPPISGGEHGKDT
jgi:sulfur carrier protein ThiS